MRLVRIGPKLSGAQILDYEGEDTLFSAEIEDFGHSKFLGILKDLFSKRSLSGCRAEPCRVKGRALAFPTKGGESYGIEV
jgi:hypothetical protein